MKPGTVIFLLIALGGGAYLLWRALQGGGPLFYFFSAVAFGMAIASLQQFFTRPRDR